MAQKQKGATIGAAVDRHQDEVSQFEQGFPGARLNCMRHFLSTIDYPSKDPEVVGAPDPLIVGRATQVLGMGPAIHDVATHPAMLKG